MHGIEREREREREREFSLRELKEIIEEQKLQIKKLTSGGFMAAKLHNELAEIPTEERDMDEIKDGYQLKFVGKDYAKLQAGLKTETIITPDFEHNDKTENQNSENIFITGDNLDALKHLENAYSGKVDVIYIDPPYNTGKDGFVYADNFKFSDEDLKEKLGLTDTEISRVRALNGKSSHSAWLTFMLPRLMIAKRLLSDTGVIFISIDDNELYQLKMLCDEIFTDSNFISNLIVWQDKYTTTNDKQGISSQTDYILAFSKKTDNFLPNKLPLREEYVRSAYKNDDLDGRGRYRLVQMYKKKNPVSYEVVSPTGKKWTMPWNFTPENFERMDKESRIYWGKDGESQPQKKVYLSESTGVNPVNLLLLGQSVGYSGSGGDEIEELFKNRNIFSYPKPSSLVKHILKIASQKNSLILDFFAGSATTADAVMQLNTEDGGNRKYILVQLPEAVKKGSEAEKAGYKTIDQISRERIIRAAAKIGDKSGFKHFRLTTPEDENSLLKMEEFDPNANVAFPEDMTTSFDGGEEAILQTWLIDDGFEFNQKPKVVEFDGYKAHFIENRLYLIATGWSSDATRELLNRIGKNKLAVQTIVIFPYSFSFNELNELKTNLRTAFEKSNKIEVLERY